MTLAAPPVDPVSIDSLDELLAEIGRHPDQRAKALHQLLGEGPCRQLGIYPIPADFKLSVVIPVFNERDFIEEIIGRVQSVPIPKRSSSSTTAAAMGRARFSTASAARWTTSRSCSTRSTRAKARPCARASRMRRAMSF